MHQTSESIAVGAPSQVGARVDRTLARALHARRDAAECDFVHRQRRFARCAPDTLIRIGEDRGDDLGKTRAGVCAIRVADDIELIDDSSHSAGLYARAAAMVHTKTELRAVQPGGMLRPMKRTIFV